MARTLEVWPTSVCFWRPRLMSHTRSKESCEPETAMRWPLSTFKAQALYVWAVTVQDKLTLPDIDVKMSASSSSSSSSLGTATQRLSTPSSCSTLACLDHTPSLMTKLPFWPHPRAILHLLACCRLPAFKKINLFASVGSERSLYPHNQDLHCLQFTGILFATHWRRCCQLSWEDIGVNLKLMLLES
jgi:hypothetical protein